jgi:hypothetical protein
MDKGVCTHQAESFFSRLRRAEIGTHHHIAGPCLNVYASKMSWRKITAASAMAIRPRWWRVRPWLPASAANGQATGNEQRNLRCSQIRRKLGE